MPSVISLNQVYEELKRIENSMVTKQDINQLLDTLEIVSNKETMDQIMKSERDIKSRRLKEIKSLSDL